MLEFTQDHLNLIENVVKRNPRFSGNEDLFDDFCSETCNRSYSLFVSINNVDNLEIYLNKVASSAIINVLKNSGRLKRIKSSYEQIKEVPITVTSVYNTDDNDDILLDIPDPSSNFEEVITQQEEIKLIRNIIYKIDSAEPEKKYFEIFKCRYLTCLKQSEIAVALGISQGEVSKRLSELAYKINDHLNKVDA